jgi:hypothetical protein
MTHLPVTLYRQNRQNMGTCLNCGFKTLNYHQLEAGGLTIGGLNRRRLEEKAAGSRWFAPRAERPSGGLKPPTNNQVH